MRRLRVERHAPLSIVYSGRGPKKFHAAPKIRRLPNNKLDTGSATIVGSAKFTLTVSPVRLLQAH